MVERGSATRDSDQKPDEWSVDVPEHWRSLMSGPTAHMGVIYLLHFERRYQHAAHYMGWAGDPEQRLAEHAAGHGARLLAVVKAAGITWTLSRTWTGTRSDERALKRQGGASRRCPACGVTPRRCRPGSTVGSSVGTDR